MDQLLPLVFRLTLVHKHEQVPTLLKLLTIYPNSVLVPSVHLSLEFHKQFSIHFPFFQILFALPSSCTISLLLSRTWHQCFSATLKHPNTLHFSLPLLSKNSKPFLQPTQIVLQYLINTFDHSQYFQLLFSNPYSNFLSSFLVYPLQYSLQLKIHSWYSLYSSCDLFSTPSYTTKLLSSILLGSLFLLLLLQLSTLQFPLILFDRQTKPQN